MAEILPLIYTHCFMSSINSCCEWPIEVFCPYFCYHFYPVIIEIIYSKHWPLTLMFQTKSEKSMLVLRSGLYLCDSLSCCRESGHQADCSSSICLTLQLAIWHLDHSVGDLGHNTLHTEYFIITQVTRLRQQYWYRCFTFPLTLSEVGHRKWHTGPVVNLKTQADFCLDIDQFACTQWQQSTGNFSTLHCYFTFHVI